MIEVAKQPNLTAYGPPKCIRYMVNSTPEFIEVIYAVNGIIGTLTDPKEVELIHRASKFSTIPLPHSQSKFIACFEIPGDLLGASSARRPLLLDFSERSNEARSVPIVRKPPQVLLSHPVRTLYDINFALYLFEASLAPTIPASQWFRVKRSISISIANSETPDGPIQMLIAAEANPALPIGNTNPQ
jgi:hypothetical protein